MVETQSVWVLMGGRHYEEGGRYPLGVYASAEAAQRVAEQSEFVSGWDEEWVGGRVFVNRSPNGHSDWFTIHEFAVTTL